MNYNKDIKISIIVPVYNGEETVECCINSILNQTLSELELIVVDDGSTDKTEDICKSFHDDRIIYVYKENGGPSSARNMGLTIAQGEYIGFVDADDYIVPEMCEKMYQASIDARADICVCDYSIVFDDGKNETYTDLLRNGTFDKQQINNEVLRNFLGHIDPNGNIAKYDWAIIRRFFNRDFLHRNNLRFNESLSNSEDCLFAYLTTKYAEKMVYLKNEYLYVNLRNAESLTRRYLPDYWQQRCKLIDELENVINEDQLAWSTDSFPLFIMRCVRPTFTNIAYGFGKENVFHSLKEFSEVVHDYRVRKMCDVVKTDGLNDEWMKLFQWCRNKQYITLYFYYMDVQYGSRVCHIIRRLQKAVQRRIFKR